MHNKVLYFSILEKRRTAFNTFVTNNGYDKKFDFNVISIKEIDFRVSSDLLLFLDELAADDKTSKCLECLTVIIDYVPFFSKKYNEGYEIASKNIRNAILGYPEVLFLFDESLFEKNGKRYFKYFLFKSVKERSERLYEDYHVFHEDQEPFIALKEKHSNLFDGSNLRYALKLEEYSHLKVQEANYKRVQFSRSHNLVLCVEEERTQNRFNSYAAYANGCRVLPIMTATGLMSFNQQCASNIDSVKDLKLIMRDYDLQFSDVSEEKKSVLNIVGKKEDENNVDYIRGAKDLAIKTAKKGKWRLLEQCDNNHFWKDMCKVPRIFISKGANHIEIVSSYHRYRLHRPDDFKSRKDSFTGLFCERSKQWLRGINKPVTGLYHSFHHIKIIKDLYKEVGWEDYNRHQDGYLINTDRKDHDHGVPLDIYELAKGMIDRSRWYFDTGKYVFAAIVAQETIEVLNGFHESLGLKAYHIYAISENAICMNILGGNEKWLRDDARFRIRKIRCDVTRMLARKGKKSSLSLSKNILNQIYTDCREYCYNKEHFLSEDVFIGAMARLNEGSFFSKY